MTTTTATLSTLAAWFRAHHPDVDVAELHRWTHTLPAGHTAIQLADALEEWHEDHPDTPPRPAHIAQRIREPGARRRIREHRQDARDALPAPASSCPHLQLLERNRRRLSAMGRIRVTTHPDGLTIDALDLAGRNADLTAIYELTELADGRWTYHGLPEPLPLGELLWAITCSYDPEPITTT